MKKLISLLLCLLLALGSGIVAKAQDVDEDFDAFMEDFFIEEVESDYMTLHYTLKDWREMGIKKPDLVIGVATWEDYADSAANYADLMREMEGFDYDALSDVHQHDYDTLYFYFDHMKRLNEYPLFDFYFAPGQGIIDNLLTNFTEYAFYEKEDIDDYLAVLASVDGYMDGAIEITQKQAAEGYFLTDSALEETLDAIDLIVEKKDDNKLIVIFNNGVDEFDGFTDAEREDYKKRNRDIVIDSFIPAYQKARNALVALKGSRKYGDAVADLPDGKAYYEVLAQFKASTKGSVQDLLDICMDAYMPLIYELSFGSMDAPGKVSIEKPTDILNYLKNHLEDFPQGPDTTFKAEYLDPSVANASIIAYYLNPPINDVSDNVIKINGSNVGDVNELYSTLAHEGYPGHLYQVTWYLSQNPSRARSLVSNIGYTEGWAMYAESLMWDKSGMDAASASYNRVLTNLNYILDVIVDLGVNGLGWSKEELADIVENRLFLNAEVVESLYEFVTQSPAQIVPYGLGVSQFLRFADNVQAEKGNDFDIVEFHRVLLENGDRPFHVVEADILAHYGDVDLEVLPMDENGVPDEMIELMRGDSTGTLAMGIAIAATLAGVVLICAIIMHAKKRKGAWNL